MTQVQPSGPHCQSVPQRLRTRLTSMDQVTRLAPSAMLAPSANQAQGPNCQQEYHIRKLPFRNEGKVKTFPNKQKLRDFITTRHTSQEMLKGILQVERKDDIATLNI